MTASLVALEIRGRLDRARMVLLCAVVLGGLASAGGITQQLLFNRPGTLKYAVTVGLSLYLLIVICAPKPLLTMAVVTTAVAPFSTTATFAAVPVTLGLLSLVAAVAVHLTSRYTPWHDVRARRGSLALAVPVAVAALALPLLNSQSPTPSTITILAMVGTGWLIGAVAREGTNRYWILAALVVGTTVQAGFAIFEFVSGTPLNLHGGSGGYGSSYFFSYPDGAGTAFRPSAALPDPIALGNVLAISAPLLLSLIFLLAPRNLRLVVAAAGALSITGLAVTLSRMSWIGAAFGLLTCTLLFPPRKILPALAALATSCVPAILFALSLGGGALATRFATVADPTAASAVTRTGDLTRLALWDASLSVATAHPFLGVGLGNLPPYLVAMVPDASVVSHAHSTYLNILAEAGAFGLLGVLLVVLSAIKDGLRGFGPDRIFYAGVIGALMTMLVTWSTDYAIRAPSVAMLFAVLIGLAASGAAAPAPGRPAPDPTADAAAPAAIGATAHWTGPTAATPTTFWTGPTTAIPTTRPAGPTTPGTTDPGAR